MEAFRRVRASLQNRITRLLAIPSFDPAEVTDRLAIVETLREQLYENNDDLIKTCDEADLEDIHSQYFDDTERLSLLTLRIRRAETRAETPSTDNPSGASSRMEFKPPVWKLNKFAGTAAKWPAFSALFLESAQGLAPAQKLHYLHSALANGPLAVIEYISPSPDAFNNAWEILVAKYEDKKQICYSLVEKIFDLPDTSKPEDYAKMVDVTREVVKGLENNGFPYANIADVILVPFLRYKLDALTAFNWDQSIADGTIPTLEDLLKFLQKWSRNGRLSAPQPQAPHKSSDHKGSHSRAPFSADRKPMRSSSTSTCPECRLPHYLYRCPTFVKGNTEERAALAKRRNCCINCLIPGHFASSCPSTITCHTCNKRHHTSLHAEKPKITSLATGSSSVLLATASITILDRNKRPKTLRALVDPGSQVSLITRAAQKGLNLNTVISDTKINAVGERNIGNNGFLQAAIRSKDGSESFATTLHVIPKITTPLPATDIPQSTLTQLTTGKDLADPQYYRSAQIDVLLGADIYARILRGNLEKQDNMTAQETSLGWILFGAVQESQTTPKTCHLLLAHFQKFWEIEDTPALSKPILTPDEQKVEDHFMNTHRRLEDGSFEVRIPLSQDPPNLGSSREIAVSRYKSLAARFRRDPQYAERYRAAMESFIQQGHIEIAPPVSNPERLCYLPHHAVPKRDSDDLRIVFDASAKTSNGKSLNDVQLAGPKLQSRPFTLLVRFRSHTVAITCDISHMYPRIHVHTDDRDLQRIIWESPSGDGEPTDFRSTKVTFGEKGSSYLAMRVTKEAAATAEDPTVRLVLDEDLYVDDLLSGAETPEEAAALRENITKTLAECGFPTHKWNSSHNANKEEVQISGDTSTLGIIWSPTEDTFQVEVTLPHIKKWTRRSVLSMTNTIFDPLGWLSPVVVIAKIMLKDIVQTTTSWDEPLGKDETKRWTAWKEDVAALKALRIPRRIFPHGNSSTQLVAFCDASEKAYSAVVYARDHGHKPVLIAAKTKVTPSKPQSLPRLELLGALLLSKLVAAIKEALRKPDMPVHAYTDSSITLGWLRAHPSKWHTFVANRVTAIQEVIPGDKWQHVKTAENPADAASRGITAQELLNHRLWWHGPTWLQTTTNSGSHPLPLPLPDQKTTHVITMTPPSPFIGLMEKFSSWRKIRRIIAQVMRFIRLCRKSDAALTADDYKNADVVLYKILQQDYRMEIERLLQKKATPSTSSLVKLNPFLDKNGLLRVGGRLVNADLPFEQRHPLILAPNQYTTKLIRDMHLNHSHARSDLLATILRSKYYIPHILTAIKNVTRRCVTCTRISAKMAQQMMANLPDARVRAPERAFCRCGVDFAGPITLKTQLARGTRHYKAWIALFVCMATRAIHLELVTSLSTEAFLAAFTRFTSRRGTPTDIYSDNGTNFTGAARELDQITAEAAPHLAEKTIQWHFNPPSAPHFGGLWEAGVKSTKTHLKTIVGQTPLTFEEYYTILTKVEATLNSRPLAPLSADPEDFQALTPAHFLIGGPFSSPPEEDLTQEKPNTLNRWQLVQAMTQHFWRRWSTEYLTRLQNRPKWWMKKPPLEVGRLVLIAGDTSSLTWRMGRITALTTGKDGLPRSATIKTAYGEVQRPIVKLCILPLDQEEPST